MAYVSLILPSGPEPRPEPSAIDAWRLGLEGAGHEVEVLLVGAGSVGSGPGWRAEAVEGRGRAAAAVTGLRRARGEILLVLDPSRSYAPADLARVVAPLAEGRAELAIAVRGRTGPDGAIAARGGLLGAIVRAMVGTAAPASGLIGLTRGALEAVRDHFRPAGGTFAFEILARVGGRWAEVPVGPAPAAIAGRRPGRPGLDDLRQWKRLADHRFGNASRLIQFCAVGGSGMVIDLGCYFAFQPIFARTALAHYTVPPTEVKFDLFAARALAIAVALVWNFSLNRRLTFSFARSGSVGRQFATYLLSNAPGVALSLATSLGLARRVAFFDEHKLAAAVVGIVAATGISFSMSRWVVFQDRNADQTPPGPKGPRAKVAREVERAGISGRPADGF